MPHKSISIELITIFQTIKALTACRNALNPDRASSTDKKWFILDLKFHYNLEFLSSAKLVNLLLYY